MKQTKRAPVLVSVLIMSCIWGFIVAYKTGYIPTGLHVLILALIMIAGIRESGIDAFLGGGIMTMAVISIVIKIYLTRHYHENQD